MANLLHLKFKSMNLIISDQGDESVGIFPASYTLETPISDTDDLGEIEFFREQAINMYSQLAQGKVTAMYEWELEAMERQMFVDDESGLGDLAGHRTLVSADRRLANNHDEGDRDPCDYSYGSGLYK